ncbi:MAG: hypothetical protein ABL995_20890 [Bryobacteraceae bacterium]
MQHNNATGTYLEGDLRTDISVRERVRARHVEGDSNRRIARTENLDPKTVGRILSQREFVEILGRERSRCLSLMPVAISRIEEALGSGAIQVRVLAAFEILDAVCKMHVRYESRQKRIAKAKRRTNPDPPYPPRVWPDFVIQNLHLAPKRIVDFLIAKGNLSFETRQRIDQIRTEPVLKKVKDDLARSSGRGNDSAPPVHRKGDKDMSSEPKEPKATPSQTLRTPLPVQTRVLANHMRGESQRQIAREEGLDRATVSRILSQPEYIEAFALQQSQILMLAPKAMAVLNEALDCDDLRTALPVAFKISDMVANLHAILDPAEKDWVKEEIYNAKAPPKPRKKRVTLPLEQPESHPADPLPQTPAAQSPGPSRTGVIPLTTPAPERVDEAEAPEYEETMQGDEQTEVEAEIVASDSSGERAGSPSVSVPTAQTAPRVATGQAPSALKDDPQETDVGESTARSAPTPPATASASTNTVAEPSQQPILSRASLESFGLIALKNLLRVSESETERQMIREILAARSKAKSPE